MSVGEFWPEKGVQRNDWVLNYRDSAPAGLSGGSIAVPLGEPFWTIDVTVQVPSRSALASEWQAFFGRRKGKRNTFTANRSFHHAFPAARNVQSDANLIIDAIDRANATVQISESAGGIVSPTAGDMLGYYTAKQGYYCAEILQVLSATSTSALAEVAPAPWLPHGTQANPRRIKPVAEFRLDAQPQPNETSSRRSWSFKATQVIRG